MSVPDDHSAEPDLRVKDERFSSHDPLATAKAVGTALGAQVPKDYPSEPVLVMKGDPDGSVQPDLVVKNEHQNAHDHLNTARVMTAALSPESLAKTEPLAERVGSHSMSPGAPAGAEASVDDDGNGSEACEEFRTESKPLLKTSTNLTKRPVKYFQGYRLTIHRVKRLRIIAKKWSKEL